MNEIDLTPLIAALAELFPEVEPARCWNCPSREVHAKGLCSECYYRWDHAGRPEQVPDWQRPPYRGTPRYRRQIAMACLSLGSAAAAQARRQRIEDYAFMLAAGESRDVAARRLGGLSRRTLDRYDAALAGMDVAA